MAGEGPGHVHPGQDLFSGQPGPLPEGDHAVRIDGVPAVEEDDLMAFHDRAHGQEGREVEHEIGTAVDQRDLARLEGAEDSVQGGHGGDEGRTRFDAGFRDDEGLGDERDGYLPGIRGGTGYKIGGGGEEGESITERIAAELFLSQPRPYRGSKDPRAPTDVRDCPGLGHHRDRRLVDAVVPIPV